jgi:hypothetical protein
MLGINRLTCWTATRAVIFTALMIGCTSTEPEPPEPPEQPVAGLRLEAVTDTTLRGTVGIWIGTIPVVRLTLDGKPAPGREVRFWASNGGTIAVAVQRTDTAGLASPGAWTLGTDAQPQTLTARTAGAANVVFTAVPSAGMPATAEIVAGNYQSGPAGTALPIPLRVKLSDRFGNPVPDAEVIYTVIAGAGTLAGATARTDSSGIASSGTWMLGGAGAQVVTTSVAGKSLFFDAFACDDRCRGRDLLFSTGPELFSLVDGVRTSLYTGDALGRAVELSPADAAWSPDGQKIAFTVNLYDWAQDTSHVSLYLMDADGSNLVLREDGFSNPSWSPDGQQLAVVGPAGVYLISAEPNDAPPILLAEHAYDPAWSPDGTQIAFADVTAIDVNLVGALKVMHADGTGLRTLVSDAFGGIGAPTWSPDGTRLAFTMCEPSSCGGLFIVNLGGGDPVELNAGLSAAEPAWSPDGSRIAFVYWTPSESGIAWLPADGSIATPIPIIPFGGYPAWRP